MTLSWQQKRIKCIKNSGMEKEMRSLVDNDNSQEEYECPGCGQPTSGTDTESGSKTALCEDCFNRQRWDDEGGVQHNDSDK